MANYSSNFFNGFKIDGGSKQNAGIILNLATEYFLKNVRNANIGSRDAPDTNNPPSLKEKLENIFSNYSQKDLAVNKLIQKQLEMNNGKKQFDFFGTKTSRYDLDSAELAYLLRAGSGNGAPSQDTSRLLDSNAAKSTRIGRNFNPLHKYMLQNDEKYNSVITTLRKIYNGIESKRDAGIDGQVSFVQDTINSSTNSSLVSSSLYGLVVSSNVLSETRKASEIRKQNYNLGIFSDEMRSLFLNDFASAASGLYLYRQAAAAGFGSAKTLLTKGNGGVTAAVAGLLAQAAAGGEEIAAAQATALIARYAAQRQARKGSSKTAYTVANTASTLAEMLGAGIAVNQGMHAFNEGKFDIDYLTGKRRLETLEHNLGKISLSGVGTGIENFVNNIKDGKFSFANPGHSDATHYVTGTEAAEALRHPDHWHNYGTKDVSEGKELELKLKEIETIGADGKVKKEIRVVVEGADIDGKEKGLPDDKELIGKNLKYRNMSSVLVDRQGKSHGFTFNDNGISNEAVDDSYTLRTKSGRLTLDERTADYIRAGYVESIDGKLKSHSFATYDTDLEGKKAVPSAAVAPEAEAYRSAKPDENGAKVVPGILPAEELHGSPSKPPVSNDYKLQKVAVAEPAAQQQAVEPAQAGTEYSRPGIEFYLNGTGYDHNAKSYAMPSTSTHPYALGTDVAVALNNEVLGGNLNSKFGYRNLGNIDFADIKDSTETKVASMGQQGFYTDQIWDTEKTFSNGNKLGFELGGGFGKDYRTFNFGNDIAASTEFTNWSANAGVNYTSDHFILGADHSRTWTDSFSKVQGFETEVKGKTIDTGLYAAKRFGNNTEIGPTINFVETHNLPYITQQPIDASETLFGARGGVALNDVPHNSPDLWKLYFQAQWGGGSQADIERIRAQIGLKTGNFMNIQEAYLSAEQIEFVQPQGAKVPTEKFTDLNARLGIKVGF